MGGATERLRLALKRRGVVGLLKRAPAFVYHRVRSLPYTLRFHLKERRENFDSQFGTDTGDMLGLERLDIDPTVARLGVHYEPSMPAEIREAIALSGVKPEDATFIDIGCGKGGLLIVAALIGGIVWWLASIGLNVAGNMAVLGWVILICVAVLLAVGLSWSHIWRRLTGQVEVDDDKP